MKTKVNTIFFRIVSDGSDNFLKSSKFLRYKNIMKNLYQIHGILITFYLRNVIFFSFKTV